MIDLPPILQDVVNALTACGPRAKVADLRWKLLYTTTDVVIVRERLHELRQLDRVVVEHHGGESYWSLLGQVRKGNAKTPPTPKRRYQRKDAPAPAPQAVEQEKTEVLGQSRVDEDEKEREKREKKEQRERDWQATRDAANRAEALELERRKALLEKLPSFSDAWEPTVQAAWFASFQKLMDPL